MTREEAIKQLENLLLHCRSMQRDDELIWGDDCDALKTALSALTPPTQEQMARVWTGCQNCTQTKARQNLGYQYCEHCGRPLTPAAWEELRKRWEALDNESHSD